MSFEQVTIGPCTLYRGDAREVLPSLTTFDALITDPPYGVEFRGKATKHTTKRTGGYESGDDADVGPAVVEMALPQCVRGLVFSGNRQVFRYPEPDDIGCVYCPSGAGIGRWGFVCMHSVLFYGKRPGSALYPASMQSFDTEKCAWHPCPKPLPWMRWAVGLASLQGELVVDPFLGSGKTAIACIQMERRFVGIELESRYFDGACEDIARAWQDKCSELPFDEPQPLRQRELLEA